MTTSHVNSTQLIVKYKLHLLWNAFEYVQYILGWSLQKLEWVRP